MVPRPGIKWYVLLNPAMDSFDRDAYLTSAQLVERWKGTPLQCSYVTLARRRARGQGPAWCLAGHNDNIYYSLETIEAYELSTQPHVKA